MSEINLSKPLLAKKLIAIQAELRAPKSQRNDFGKYNYRNCEDILEAVKPILLKYEATLVVSDTIEMIGDRYYVRATAELFCEHGTISVDGCARETTTKKGMDEAQITGAASSYARKYALNGLFCIDDTKDADSQDNRNNANNRPKCDLSSKKNPTLLGSVIAKATHYIEKVGKDQVLDFMQIKSSSDLKKWNDGDLKDALVLLDQEFDK